MIGRKRKILVFTGSRAEYGLQYPILQAIAQEPQLEYQLFVAGTHFDKQFGCTLSEIEADGWQIHAKKAFTLASDQIQATALTIGTGINLCHEVFSQLQPDICLVYGDRFEAFAALVASTQMGIPTAHVEGGDITEGGTLDDSVRHAMTKLAHIHFVTNTDAASRLQRLYEEPWRIHNVGYPGNDLVYAKRYASTDELVRMFGLVLTKPLILFTQHPIPTCHELALTQLEPSLAALEELAKAGMQVLITYPNSDAGSRHIIERLATFADGLPAVQLHTNLGRYNYHGLLALITQVTGGVCLGNSSSGIKETPAFVCPTVNIGDRQAGRLQAGNVLNVDYSKDHILAAIQQAMTAEFHRHCQQCTNPYGLGNSGQKVAKILQEVKLDSRLLCKKMANLL